MEGIASKEVKATHYQTVIQDLLGRTITKKEALNGLKLHEEIGDGGNTVGWKYDRLVNGQFKCTHGEHTILGDAIIELGRMAEADPLIKWSFPESYRTYKPAPENSEDIFRINL